MRCPFCQAENLEGAEQCELCGQDLTAVSARRRKKDVLTSTLLGHLSDVSLNEPLVLPSDSNVADAVGLMRQQRHGSVQVVDDEILVGIFTESDLLRRVDPGADLSTVYLSEVMTASPQSYEPHQTVAAALNGMSVRGHRHLPILQEDGVLAGFVSVRGLLRHIHEKVGF